jgi:hypothetical protein
MLTCDKYKSSLRHIHDPVLSSLKMKGIRLPFWEARCSLYSVRVRVMDFSDASLWGNKKCDVEDNGLNLEWEPVNSHGHRKLVTI